MSLIQISAHNMWPLSSHHYLLHFSCLTTEKKSYVNGTRIRLVRVRAKRRNTIYNRGKKRFQLRNGGKKWKNANELCISQRCLREKTSWLVNVLYIFSSEDMQTAMKIRTIAFVPFVFFFLRFAPYYFIMVVVLGIIEIGKKYSERYKNKNASECIMDGKRLRLMAKILARFTRRTQHKYKNYILTSNSQHFFVIIFFVTSR